MSQFYFLSVICNAISGAIFSFLHSTKDFEDGQDPAFNIDVLKDKTFLLVMSITSMVISFMKIFLPMTVNNGSRVFLLGDFFPILAGVVASLIYAYRYALATEKTEKTPNFLKIVAEYDKYIGFICLGIAGLHFLFADWILF